MHPQLMGEGSQDCSDEDRVLGNDLDHPASRCNHFGCTSTAALVGADLPHLASVAEISTILISRKDYAPAAGACIYP